MTPRYASRRSTVHHRVAIVNDVRSWSGTTAARSSETAVTCSDEVFGKRKASRSSTARHHRPVTADDPMRTPRRRPAQDPNPAVRVAATRADDIVGTRTVRHGRTGVRLLGFL